VRQGWDRFVGPNGVYVTVERFGASAPYQTLAERFGFTAKDIVRQINEA
jgi:transketolase